MDIRLNKLVIENFKGLQSFVLALDGKSVSVYGGNASGKSTLMDAFLWLLFGRDSRGRSDFEIKTLDESGQAISGLDHSVEAHLLIDGQPLVLKKTYREKWTKKRGSAKATLTGHEMDHYIDGVPSKKREFEQRISSLVNEDTFKLLTSPGYFNSLHWQKRRDVLLQVCGDVEDKDVIASDQGLAALPEILGNRSLDEHRKVVKARQSEINRRLHEIPARIDEGSRSLPEQIGSPDQIRDGIYKLDKEIADIKAGSDLPKLRKEMAEAQAELAELQGKHQEKVSTGNRGIATQIEDARAKHRQISDNINRNLASIEDKEQELERLREQFKAEAGTQPETNDACPTCNQKLPEDQVQAAIEKFNTAKSERLEGINARGKKIKAEIDKLKSETKGLEGEARKIEDDIEALKNTESSRSGLEPKIEKAKARVDEIAGKINQYVEPDVTGLEQEKEALVEQLSAINSAEKTKARIEELKTEEKSLSREYERLEKEAHLMEQFVVRKVNLLESKINSKFALARFKLFEQQINQGIAETCQVVHQGVPWGNLNSAARINVGLDIIRVLSEHYGVRVPTFVDHSESVVNMIDPGTQLIKLVVSKNHKKLEVK